MANWKFKRNDQVTGPYSEDEIYQFLTTSKLLPGDTVKRDDAPWRDAVFVRQLFRDLHEHGWFLQSHGSEKGPFTPARLLELRTQNRITDDVLVRRASKNEWTRFADAQKTLRKLILASQKQAAGIAVQDNPPAVTAPVPSKVLPNHERSPISTTTYQSPKVRPHVAATPVVAANQDQWFLREGDAVSGPISEIEFRRRLRAYEYELCTQARNGDGSWEDIELVRMRFQASKYHDIYSNGRSGVGGADSSQPGKEEVVQPPMPAVTGLTSPRFTSTTRGTLNYIRKIVPISKRLRIAILTSSFCILGIVSVIAINGRHSQSKLAEGDATDEDIIRDTTKQIEAGVSTSKLFIARANALESLGRFGESVEDFTRAIELSPNDSGLFNERGRLWAQLGWRDKATKDYTDAISLDRNNVDALFNRGVLYRNSGKPQLALDDLEKVIELSPKDVKAFQELAIAWTAAGRFDMAIQALSSAIEIDETNVQSYYLRAQRYDLHGDLKKSEADYEKALFLLPTSGAAHSGLVHVREKLQAQAGSEVAAPKTPVSARDAIKAAAPMPQKSNSDILAEIVTEIKSKELASGSRYSIRDLSDEQILASLNGAYYGFSERELKDAIQRWKRSEQLYIPPDFETYLRTDGFDYARMHADDPTAMTEEDVIKSWRRLDSRHWRHKLGALSAVRDMTRD